MHSTIGLYTFLTRCHTSLPVTLKYTEDSSLTELRHSLPLPCEQNVKTLPCPKLRLRAVKILIHTIKRIILTYNLLCMRTIVFFRFCI